MNHKIHGFEEEPPKIAYIDPSFFINLMVKDSRFFVECKNYSQKLAKDIEKESRCCEEIF